MTMRLAGEFRELLGARLRISLGHVDAGADRGGTHVLGVEILLGVAQERDLGVERRGERVELLAHGHRHRVLELRCVPSSRW
jgi:hypothetical protein